jgi:hypothetical protein
MTRKRLVMIGTVVLLFVAAAAPLKLSFFAGAL